MDRSLASRIGGCNESVQMREDEQVDDDDEFFQQNGSGFYGQGSEETVEQQQEIIKHTHDAQYVEQGSSQQPYSSESVNSRRFTSNLSKISEAVDENSFSFKQGDEARKMFERDHEKVDRQNYLRLPSTSFHGSRYSIKHSWEESALRPQNETISSFARSELDLSRLSTTKNKHQKQQLSPADRSSRSSISSTHTSSLAISPPVEEYQFLSGSRHVIYFGFCRLDNESLQSLIVRNIHPRRETIRIRCGWLRRVEEHGKHFQILLPQNIDGRGRHKQNQQQELIQLLTWDQATKIVIGFTPPESAYYKNILRIESKSTNDTREYYFLVHGYGGRAVVEPELPDRPANLCFSASGQYQLIVQTASKFHFSLKNLGKRSAFVTLLFYYPTGSVEIPSSELFANMRNLLLSKEGVPEPSEKVIEVRYLGTKTASQPAMDSGSGREVALRIGIVWGEEKQRQRLKSFEVKEMANLFGELKFFGMNFTTKRIFDGEKVEIKEPSISEEELYCFDSQTRITFINVIERLQFDQRSHSLGSIMPPSGQLPLQRRSGSALSIASNEGRKEPREHHTIVEADLDDTLTDGANVRLNYDDDTLT